MTDEVLLSIVGMHENAGDEDRTELVTTGKYYLKNGRHYLCYDDDDEMGNVVTNVLRIADDRLDIMRHGSQKVHMAFKRGEESMTSYPTPAGNMSMDIYTDELSSRVDENSLEAVLKYSLSLNNSFVNNCTVVITARSKESPQPFSRR